MANVSCTYIDPNFWKNTQERILEKGVKSHWKILESVSH